jgi:hypothetical protein
MKLYELAVNNGGEDLRLRNHAVPEITNSYKNGHVSYEEALKRLTHHGLSIQQAKQQLMGTGTDVDAPEVQNAPLIP